jgi:transcriptional regulator with XRE-family HTH domain/tetratricopeptide (TPR) repeat protein
MDVDGAGFGAQLRECREAAGLSQQELADRSGLSVRAVSNMERGRTKWPYRDSLSRLADALGLRERARAEFLAAVPRRQLAHPLAEPGAAAAGRGPGIGAEGSDGRGPRQLPAGARHFTGRAAELAVLEQLLTESGTGAVGTVVISAIGGTAGVGKTALALHWAHRVAGRFADGQLYANLRGFDPAGTPATPAEVIRGFLHALGVPAARMPASLEAQAGLYRDLLSGKRMLFVLDNGRDEQQVRPLLPASPASLVLVTSRNQQAGLAAADAARLLTLDVLSHAEAVQLLTARLGTHRAAAEPGTVEEIAQLCACLPLALVVAAARAATRPGFPLAALAAELADTAGRLDALDAGDPVTRVRAVFSWSTRQLSGEDMRMFRLLGLHPGPDISVPAAASLAATTQADARRVLGELARAHLITERVPGRYAFHDLLRAYASEEAHNAVLRAEREAALARVLDHYLHTADRAGRLLTPSTEPVMLDPPRPGAATVQLDDYAHAMVWFEEEHQVLLAVVTLAAGIGNDCHAWQLPWAMSTFLQLRGQWHDWAATQRVALAAAMRLGDTAAQALSGRILANACSYLGDYDGARRHYADSLALYHGLGNRGGEAKIQHSLGLLAERQGSYADALGHAEQALRLYQFVGNKTFEAVALNSVGWLHGMLGDYQQARAFCQRSLALCTETGYRRIEGEILDSLGYAEHHLGNLAEAAACYQRALGALREAGDRYGQAAVLTHLGDTRQAAGNLARAREAWQQALNILDDIQHPDADKVRAKLDVADDQVAPSSPG